MTLHLPTGQAQQASRDAGAHARHFPVSTGDLERVAAAVLDAARRGGATSAETEVSQGIGQSVTVRQAEVETIAYNRDKGISVTVYVGQRRGHASTADFADEAIAGHRRQGAGDRTLHGRGSGRGTRRSAIASRAAGPTSTSITRGT